MLMNGFLAHSRLARLMNAFMREREKIADVFFLGLCTACKVDECIHEREGEKLLNGWIGWDVF